MIISYIEQRHRDSCDNILIFILLKLNHWTNTTVFLPYIQVYWYTGLISCPFTPIQNENSNNYNFNSDTNAYIVYYTSLVISGYS